MDPMAPSRRIRFLEEQPVPQSKTTVTAKQGAHSKNTREVGKAPHSSTATAHHRANFTIVFIDRDGTINREVDLLNDERQLELLEGSSEAIKLLNEKGFLVVITTNQPQVAKGLCSEDDVKRINAKLLSMLKAKGARVDAVYYCPHHPEKGHPGENPKYKIDCDCRKPKIGMLEQAARNFGVKLADCWVVGDQTRDVQTAKNAGCRSILVRTGYGGGDGKYESKPDYACANLLEAAKLIIGGGVSA